MTLAEQIENDLKTHILSGDAPPCRLTLSGIADYYGVSLMPVRAAVDALVERRYLLRRDNRRLAINRQRKRRTSRPSPQRRRAAPPDQAITDEVIHLSLQGCETYVREEATADRFGVGRTVVRRIFSRLAGQRMLLHVPRCGWRVQPFRQQDMHDYLEIRETLELRALKLAWRRFDAQRLRQLLAANTPNDSGCPRLDNQLHQYWIDLAGNRYLREFFIQNGVYFQALFDRAVLNDRIVARRAAEHRRILRAILARDRAAARGALSRHICGQRANVARMFKQLSDEAEED